MARTSAILLILVLLLVHCCLAGTSDRNARIEGDQSIVKPLTDFLHRKEVTTTTRQAIADSAVAWLEIRGYLDATARLDSNVLFVSTGPLVTLSDLTLAGDTMRRFSVGRPFTPENLRAGLGRLVQVYRDSGYYFYRAQVSAIERNADSVTVLATVAPGPIVTLRHVEYKGLLRTKSRQIARYLRVDSGGAVTDNLVHQLETQAASVPFVDFYPPATVRPLAGFSDAIVELKFSERQQVLFDGGAGYDPELKSGLVWSLNVRLQNLFGDGKDISIQSARQDQGRNLLNLNYRQPLFVLGTGSFHAQLYTRDYRDQFYEFTALAGTDLSLSPQQVLGGELTWKRVDPNLGPSYRRYAADFTYGLDQRDRPVDPSRGFRFLSKVGYAFRNYSADSLSSKGSFNDTRAEVEGEYYQRIVGPVLLFGSATYRGVESKEKPLPVSEMYYVGGPGTLRGYRNEQFVAQRVAVGTIESRFRFPGGYLFGFYDGAYLNSPTVTGSVVATTETYRFGFGAGLSISDRSRSVTVSLGWNPDLAFDQPQLSIQFSSGL
jgi:outer membrane protein assembly factor BamA